MRFWLRLEGLTVAVLAVLIFARAGHSWLLFAVLFLAPDLSLIGYLAGPRHGATVYNLVHSYAGPLLLGMALLSAGEAVAVPLAWAAHIGVDRLLGFGLKYPSGFANTHLGRIGGQPSA